MKKSIVKAAACVMLAATTTLFTACGTSTVIPAGVPAVDNPTTEQVVQPTTEGVVTETTLTGMTAAETSAAEPVSTDEMLFIGDSRTMGLLEYSGVDADFFASVGMSVYNIDDDVISVPNVGKVTLTELLSNKSYAKIYLMIGINELGYDLDQTVSVYKELVDSIRQLQPNAKLFIQANLHVTKEKSDTHSYIKNATIDALNSRISEFADNQNIFYLDVNPIYDDENHALSEAYTSDGVHLYAKHYIEWGEWIVSQSEDMLKEG